MNNNLQCPIILIIISQQIKNNNINRIADNPITINQILIY